MLLVDPLARAVDGRWSIAVADRPAASAPLRRPLRDTVIYEAHVRGLTRLHPGVPPALRGTYAGLAHPAAIAELTRLGVTAIELMPVSSSATSSTCGELGRHNYWGYSPIGFCAPHAAYAASGPGGGQVAEFRAMVAALHAAGIEVLLDVVYNHTAEGPGRRAVVAARARAARVLPRHDVTGTGNSLDASSAHVQALVLESLRYWVTASASTASGSTSRSRSAATTMASTRTTRCSPRSPTTRCCRDEADRRAVGRRPPRLPRGRLPGRRSRSGTASTATPSATSGAAAVTTGDLARAIAGSSETFPPERGPLAGVSFVTAHDGFTLHDLVPTTRKHNEANGEGNRDGDDHNRSWNSGVEGPTDDPIVLEVRRRRAAGAARDPAHVAGRADAAGGRRARPHAARQQQRLLPRHAAHLGALGRRRGWASSCRA